jgi:hypothetical protein
MSQTAIRRESEDRLSRADVAAREQMIRDIHAKRHTKGAVKADVATAKASISAAGGNPEKATAAAKLAAERKEAIAAERARLAAEQAAAKAARAEERAEQAAARAAAREAKEAARAEEKAAKEKAVAEKAAARVAEKEAKEAEKAEKAAAQEKKDAAIRCMDSAQEAAYDALCRAVDARWTQATNEGFLAELENSRMAWEEWSAAVDHIIREYPEELDADNPMRVSAPAVEE